MISMDRRSSIGILWTENLLQIFCGQKIFYSSSINRRPSIGLLLTEGAPQALYGQKTFTDLQWTE